MMIFVLSREASRKNGHRMRAHLVTLVRQASHPTVTEANVPFTSLVPACDSALTVTSATPRVKQGISKTLNDSIDSELYAYVRQVVRVSALCE